MTHRKRAQFSFEFLEIVAFLLIAGTLYSFTSFVTNVEDEVGQAQSTGIAESLLSYEKDGRSANGYYKKTLYLSVPEKLKEIKSENKSIILSLETTRGENDLMVSNNFLIST